MWSYPFEDNSLSLKSKKETRHQLNKHTSTNQHIHNLVSKIAFVIDSEKLGFLLNLGKVLSKAETRELRSLFGN